MSARTHAAFAAALTAAGCATMSAIEPTSVPPAWMHHAEIKAVIEMTHPMRVAPICMERGAGPLSRACGGSGWMVVPHPCQWPQSADSYARLLCHEAEHALDSSIRHRGYTYGPLSQPAPVEEKTP